MIKVLKAGPGLDPENMIARLLGPSFEVVEFDPVRPLGEQAAEATVLLLRDVPITAQIMDRAPRLRLLQRYGQHVVGVDFAHAAKRGIFVANVPTHVTGADRIVAEHALFLMMVVAKRMRSADVSVANRVLGWPKTQSFAGKTLGLVGIGKTGIELVKLVRGFDMRVVAVKRTPDADLALQLGLDYLGDMSHLEEILAQADYVSLHLPLGPATRGLFGERCFQSMKPGAVFVNIARGPIVDQDAMCRALKSGRLAGVGLDVLAEEPINPTDELLRLNNVVITPHIAGVTDEIAEKASAVVVENIKRAIVGQPPHHLVGEASGRIA